MQQQLAQNQKALDTLEADIKQLEDQFQQLQQELTANKELEEQLKAEKLKLVSRRSRIKLLEFMFKKALSRSARS